MEKPHFSMEFKVRDYECDLQGIVNNANYQHYFEHTRHEFMLDNGMYFAELHEQGVDFVIARAELSYKTPLRAGDSFVSELWMSQKGVRYVFKQKIYRLPDRKLCNIAQFDAVCLIDGTLGRYKELDEFVVGLS